MTGACLMSLRLFPEAAGAKVRDEKLVQGESFWKRNAACGHERALEKKPR